jgi:hypothetical protein
VRQTSPGFKALKKEPESGSLLVALPGRGRVIRKRRVSVDTLDRKKKKLGLPTLKDDDIVTVPVDRRAFLTRVGLGSAAIASVAFSPACFGKSDDCDLDPQDDCDDDT